MKNKKRNLRGLFSAVKKSFVLLTIGLFLLVSNLPILHAFEAHIVSVTATIDSGIADYLVINKVYYDVDADHGSEPENEWVELYNPTDAEIDIQNWEICDNDSCDVLSSSSLVIPSLGFAVVTGNAGTWDYWNIPPEVIKIVLGGYIGGGLNNVADMLILKDATGTIIDQMNWGDPNPCWPNYNSDLWTPGPTVDEGHMLGRDPNGFDTDKPTDFKDFAPPVVSVDNIGWPCGSHGTCIHCNENFDITWTAINSNSGGDEKLSIDIIYITDNDGDGIPESAGDSTYLIADDIENTGFFNWTLQPCIYAWVWIKVIATGPENFMVSDSAISNGAFEPPVPAEEPPMQTEVLSDPKPAVEEGPAPEDDNIGCACGIDEQGACDCDFAEGDDEINEGLDEDVDGDTEAADEEITTDETLDEIIDDSEADERRPARLQISDG